MPVLYPPEYPYRPDAPLLSFGPSFSEEIALSVLRATLHENDEQPHEREIRAAAALTMLEGFHPRDHLECMLAAQGVTLHCAMLDGLARAMRPGQGDAMVIKWRASAASMSRSFLATSREMDRRQSKPLPPRPPDPGAAPVDPRPADLPPVDPPPPRPAHDTPAPEVQAANDPAPDGAARAKPRRKRAGAKTAPPPASGEAVAASPAPFPDLADLPEVPEDIETRPDGTPGSLTAYAPEQPEQAIIPLIAPIMAALGTRPGPYRLVNDPASQIEPATGRPRFSSNESPPDENPTPGAADQTFDDPPPDVLAANREPSEPRGPLDVTEHILVLNGLSRFSSSGFDPDAPPPLFEDDASEVELELISTGGDLEAEAHRAAMIAAHPDGKPIVTFRYGARRAPADGPDPPPSERAGKAPPDT